MGGNRSPDRVHTGTSGIDPQPRAALILADEISIIPKTDKLLPSKGAGEASSPTRRALFKLRGPLPLP